MNSPTPRNAAPFEVEDPTAAFRKLETFTRKILAVPKKQIDASLAEEQAAKKIRKIKPTRTNARPH